ncbi:O-antigen ligase family protein [Actinopolymorpha cephalotaxi]|uniref:O-antigen ligase n=1 Tax=Actinopolymorpha cephalotaxi TaxID=504797 RepID=A0ABX2S0Z0_9ACTN|nr:hypothetical protein [Actinopolymorpha cephalotaxi]NYH82969.1 hypothetical protein [Actinopolymorpha cephalotaxi]
MLRTATLLYIASVPFDVLPVLDGHTVSPFFAVLLVVAWVVDHWSRATRACLRKGVQAWAYAAVVWLTATLAWTADPVASRRAWLGVVTLLAVTVVLIDVLVGVLFHRALQVASLSSAVLATALLLAPADPNRADRASVDGVNEMGLAYVVAFGAACAAYLVVRESRYLHVVTFVLCFGAALHVGSRTGALAVLAVAVLAAFPQRSGARPGTAARHVALVTGGALLVTLALRALGAIPDRVYGSIADMVAGDPDRQRISEFYFAYIDDWIWRGVGPGSDASFLVQRTGTYLNSHNLLWRVWIETGIVGVALLAAVTICAAVRVVRSDRRLLVIMIGIPSLLFAVTFGSYLHATLWLSGAIIFAGGRSVPAWRASTFRGRTSTTGGAPAELSAADREGSRNAGAVE